MGEVELRGVGKRYGTVEAVRSVDLRVADGEFCALLGPSGCGKSTLLRMIAGLEMTSSGRVFVDGVDVTAVKPAKRRIAMVFQSYALYPHMTVRQNIAFSLSVAKMPKNLIGQRTDEVARILHLHDLLDRRPSELSGGQRQRVAIGRALVREPEVFLFDEPLSNLDAMLRVQMRIELAKLHQTLSATMIYVTHDQVEAMTLADRIVVLDRGRISQVGTPMELYNRPANRFVASFIGAPTMNFIPAEPRVLAGRDAVVGLPGGGEIRIATRTGVANGSVGFEVGIRPEHLRLGDGSDARSTLGGTVEILERLGNATVVYLDTPAGPFVVQYDGDVALKAGDHVGVIIDPERVHLFSADSSVV
ncbi:MAG: ABC transporter ATP-binding protein [Mesorhizobium sp.]|uniref:ABC transporter ATP-binding protein n=1 Tax=Mesorhizobium sp. TaxID=1871066 RepID=UPI001208446C|nr:ABC transporter ATP-binding protein [Mesorhizobium sp.]TIN95519.1 MAG: ABC transporter ATP-binding protein [Mesorhizobium sp.]TJU97166.1 MAG: ABC transporter ATP-binding protein [Mesorhizobium sp.]